jgi:hypothetical protein
MVQVQGTKGKGRKRKAMGRVPLRGRGEGRTI